MSVFSSNPAHHSEIFVPNRRTVYLPLNTIAEMRSTMSRVITFTLDRHVLSFRSHRKLNLYTLTLIYPNEISYGTLSKTLTIVSRLFVYFFVRKNLRVL